MQCKDIPIGGHLLLGQGVQGEDILWIKVAPDTFATILPHRMEFDAPEPRNSSRDRRERGGTYFPESNLCGWLNSDQVDWFHASHDTDEPPSYQNQSGFLTKFHKNELELLSPISVSIQVPNGFLRKYGGMTTTNHLVTIPSAEQIKNYAHRLINHFDITGVWTLTTTGSSMWVCRSDSKAPKYRGRVCAIIQLNPDASIDTDGALYFKSDASAVQNDLLAILDTL